MGGLSLSGAQVNVIKVTIFAVCLEMALPDRIDFGTLRPGQFTAPRFSSLSGALMCDSK
jgi:hypothetical protein